MPNPKLLTMESGGKVYKHAFVINQQNTKQQSFLNFSLLQLPSFVGREQRRS